MISSWWPTELTFRKRDSKEGQNLLKKSLIVYKYFEKSEEDRKLFDPFMFHVKSVVDDVLYNLLLERPEKIPS